METNTLSESKMSVLMDARNADKSFTEAIHQFLSKTKQDVEIHLLLKQASTDKNTLEWIQKGRIKEQIESVGEYL